MKKLKVIRFLQDPGFCSVGVSACVANYYNSEIDYEYVKELALKKISNKIGEEGLDSGEIGLLLNYIGFNKVTIISTDLDIYDYSWNKLSKKSLLKSIKKVIKSTNKEYRDYMKCMHKWLKREDFNNKLIIDYNFAEYIRNFLNRKKPVILTINWNMFFRVTKDDEKNRPDPINGEPEEHVVVAYSYNKKGVYVCDSHHEFYKYRLKKYRKGYYHISWENLMTIMGSGDLFLPEDFRH